MSEQKLGIDERSKLVFGNKYRMAIWGHLLQFSIDPPERFRSSDLERRISSGGNYAPQSMVWRELHNLEILGMIEEVERQHPSIYYQRAESPGWEIAAVAATALEAWSESTK